MSLGTAISIINIGLSLRARPFLNISYVTIGSSAAVEVIIKSTSANLAGISARPIICSVLSRAAIASAFCGLRFAIIKRGSDALSRYLAASSAFSPAPITIAAAADKSIFSLANSTAAKLIETAPQLMLV
ncbi:hypothetical protein ES703_87214 [subsurface metagenome]